MMAEMSMDIPKHIREVYAKANCLYTKKEVELALDKMAIEIQHEMADQNPLFLCVMVGGLIPAAGLLARIEFPLELDYVHASRYANNTVGSALIWRNKPTTSMAGRTVLIIDDILDGGITLNEIIQFCQQQNPATIHTAVLVDKQGARLQGGLPTANFTGLTVDNHFVFGYGMDYKGYLRNAPGIYAVANDHG
jgi:hypoxanthine phosphoribosyltransferase